MAACSFDLQATGNVEGVLRSARERILALGPGATFQGDEVSGVFSAPTPLGFIGGRYNRAGLGYTITIDEKPFLLPCSTIEDKLRQAVASMGAVGDDPPVGRAPASTSGKTLETWSFVAGAATVAVFYTGFLVWRSWRARNADKPSKRKAK